MTNDASNSYIELRQSIDNTFSLAELRLLCADVGIDYDHLPGLEKQTKTLALLDHIARQNRQAALLHRLRELRPQADWPTTYHVTHSGAVYAPRPLPERGVLPEPGPLPPGSRLFYSRNPLFTGRADELLRLADTFLYDVNGRNIIITQTAVAAGMGGIGKTQLAVEFAHRYGRYFPGGVFWLSFAQAETIATEIAACGGPDGLNLAPGFANLPLDDQVKMVQRAWHEPVARLLIFDNCEEERLLAEWRPQHGGCHVLVTSRRQQWDRALGMSQLRLEVLPREESIILLRRFVPELADTDADAITDELGDLPLALHLAGSFLATYGSVVSPTAYLDQLNDKQILDHASMLGRGADYSPTGHDLDVARSFAVSFARLDPANETDTLAVTLLAQVSFLAPDKPVSGDLRQALTCLLLEENDLSPDDEDNLLKVEDAWERLKTLGLVVVLPNDTILLHRLLTLFARTKVQEPESAQQAVEFAVLMALEQQIDSVNYISPIPLLLPHLYFVTDSALSRSSENSGRLCKLLGFYLEQVADYSAALFYFENALTAYEQDSGSTYPSIASILTSLGITLQKMGQMTKARKYLERALTINEQALGSTHPDTATCLNNYGLLLLYLGQLDEAQLYLERALDIRKQNLDQHHPNNAPITINFGLLLQSLGQLDEARPYLEHGLTINTQALGFTHPHTAVSLHNLGMLLEDLGQSAEAQSCLEQSLSILEQTLGPTHPDTAISLYNLGGLLQEIGQLTEARPYLERALAIREQALGPTHPDTAISLYNLGGLLQEIGQLTEARPYLERALAIYEQALGPTHPDTATSLNNLGGLLQEIGQLTEARPYLERALAIYEQALGPTHPDTATSLNNLGGLLQEIGQLTEARPYLERALAIYEQALGPTHPDTATSLNNLGGLLQEIGQLTEARPYLERALAIREQALGPTHPDTATSLNNLGGLLQEIGQLTEARPYLERALAIYEQALGPTHPYTATSLNNLGGLLQEIGQLTEARPYLERALAIREQALGPTHLDTAQSLHNLAWLSYDERDKAEAARLMRRALTVYEATLGANHPDSLASRQSLARIESELKG